ncbi:MAG: M28 family peptidase [Armatimonadetes bacterium]|nr:M28 family peptidase [Armatimonadota bacterium]
MLRLRWLWLPCLIIMITGCTSCGGGQGQGNGVVVPVFDQARAFADLVAQCNFGPRNPGSQGHADCLEWLAGQLAGADRLIRQNFQAATVFGGPYDFTNLIAVFGQGQPGVPFLLCAHWDTRPVADQDPNPANRDTPILGANDGASGVAVLLEMARAFVASPPPRPIIIVLLDAEDSGRTGSGQPYLGFCIGSRHLANNWPGDLAKPAEGVLLDIVGDPAAVFQKEQNSVANDAALVTKVWDEAARLGHTAFQSAAGGPVIDDHMPLITEGGIRVIDVIDFFPPPATWHTISDAPANCSADMLNQSGDTLLHVIYSEG